jgi:sulfur carrier protein
MPVTVELAGGPTEEIPADGKTYADLLEPFGLSVHEVSITVEGRPVPEDERVPDEVTRVRVVRLIQGG